MRTNGYKNVLIMLFILQSVIVSFGQTISPDTFNLMGDLENSYNSISTNLMTTKLVSAANEYRQYAPVPRIAQFDYAFGRDIDEYKKLNGFGILYLASLNQDSTEYPIERVYFKHKGGIVELQLIHTNAVPVTDDLIKSVFGKHRVDFYYLMPYLITQVSGQLLVDWKRNRKAFVLGEFPTGTSLDYITDKKLLFPDTERDIKNADLDIFAQREFQIKIY